MLGVVLLYVGAVLFVNGVWLYGLHRQQLLEAAPEGARLPGAERGLFQKLADAAILENREIAIVNFFTGGVGVVIATISLVFGMIREDIPSFALSGFVLLFAFTYLYVAINQFTGAAGKALGWYSLFVAVTAIPTGVIVLDEGGPDETFFVWLGIDWFAWGFLWFLYFLLLAVQAPILRFTAAVTVIEAIGTSWVFGYLLLTEKIAGL